jgi:hypothetical protein
MKRRIGDGGMGGWGDGEPEKRGIGEHHVLDLRFSPSPFLRFTVSPLQSALSCSPSGNMTYKSTSDLAFTPPRFSPSPFPRFSPRCHVALRAT